MLRLCFCGTASSGDCVVQPLQYHVQCVVYSYTTYGIQLFPKHRMLFDRTQDQSVQVLEIERDRLKNSCTHLQRSNAELQTAIEEAGPDLDFKQAIEVQ